MRTSFLVIASHRRWRGNPVNYARAYARLYYDWIATVAMLPRDDKKHHTQFPSVGGVPRSGGVVREAKKVLPSRPQVRCHTLSCHCEPSQMARQSLLYRCVPQCVARALMRPVRILVFVQTALSLVFTYSDSLRAIADGAAIQ